MEELPKDLPEAYVKVLILAQARGRTAIDQLPGVFEEVIDADWSISLNPHRDTLLDSRGFELHPSFMMVTFRGDPVGCLSAAGGAFMDEAEDDFIAALDAQLETSKSTTEGVAP